MEAVEAVELHIEKGKLFSLLGKNGAGKTTFVKIASTLLLPTSGSIRIMGFDVVSEARQAREVLAVVPQGIRPYWHLTPREHIYHYVRSGVAQGRKLEVLLHG
ncbi:MAG: ATP-binding cassette domain-containing protein [Methanomassiliicoccales archaeon]